MGPSDYPVIPRPIRHLVLIGLIVAAVAALAGLWYFSFVQREPTLAVAALGAVQTALAGLVFATFLSFSLRVRAPNDIRKVLDAFFIDQVCPALARVDPAPNEKVDYAVSGGRFLRRRKVAGRAQVLTDFSAGREDASFTIKTTDGQQIDMYLKVNVRHVTVKYYFDPELFAPDDGERDFHTAFAQTLAGAEAVGYTHRLFRRHHAGRGGVVLELSLFADFGFELMADPSRQLFLSNDLSTMTRSMLHTVRSVKLSGQAEG